MREVSLFRLYFLRSLYLLVAVGLGILVWPGVFDLARRWGLMDGQEANCMVAAFSVLCIFGLRYPLQMLPVLLWEIIWKTLWLASVLIPQWRSGHVDNALQPTVFACSWVVLVISRCHGDIYSGIMCGDRVTVGGQQRRMVQRPYFRA
jgi:hypothetical protein